MFAIILSWVLWYGSDVMQGRYLNGYTISMLYYNFLLCNDLSSTLCHLKINIFIKKKMLCPISDFLNLQHSYVALHLWDIIQKQTHPPLFSIIWNLFPRQKNKTNNCIILGNLRKIKNEAQTETNTSRIKGKVQM